MRRGHVAESRDIHLFFWLPSFVATVVIVVLPRGGRAGVMGDEMTAVRRLAISLPRLPEEAGERERGHYNYSGDLRRNDLSSLAARRMDGSHVHLPGPLSPSRVFSCLDSHAVAARGNITQPLARVAESFGQLFPSFFRFAMIPGLIMGSAKRGEEGGESDSPGWREEGANSILWTPSGLCMDFSQRSGHLRAAERSASLN